MNERTDKAATLRSFVSRLTWGGLGLLLAVVVIRLVDSPNLQHPALSVVAAAAVIVVTAVLPHFVIEMMAHASLAASGVPTREQSIGFKNAGAVLGLFERPLWLISLIAGFPAFVAIWLAFKVVSNWRAGSVEKSNSQWATVYLLENAISLLGVAGGWFLWSFLNLPH